MSEPSASAYGLIMADDAMAPLYERGDTVICDPEREIASGKDIVVWFKDENRAPLIRQLKERTPNGFILETVAEPRRIEAVPLDEVEKDHGIAGMYRARGLSDEDPDEPG